MKALIERSKFKSMFHNIDANYSLVRHRLFATKPNSLKLFEALILLFSIIIAAGLVAAIGPIHKSPEIGDYSFKGIGDFFENFGNLIRSPFAWLQEHGLRGILEAIGNFFKWIGKILWYPFKLLGKFFSWIWNVLKTFFARLYNWLKSLNFKGFFGKLGEYCLKPFKWIYSGIKCILGWIGKFFIGIKDFFVNLFKSIGKFFRGHIHKPDIPEMHIKERIGNFFKLLWKFILAPFRLIKKIIKQIWQGLINLFKYTFTGIKFIFSNIYLGIKWFFSTIFSGIKWFFSKIFSGFKCFFSGIKNFFSGIPDWFKAHSFFDGLKKFFKLIFNGILYPFRLIHRLLNLIGHFFKIIGLKICDFFHCIATSLKNLQFTKILGNIWYYLTYPFRLIWRGLVWIWVHLCKFFRSIIDFFKAHLHWPKFHKPVIRELGIKSRICNFFNLLWRIILSPFRAIKCVLRYIWKGITIIFGKIWAFLKCIWNHIYNFFAKIFNIKINLKGFFVAIGNAIAKPFVLLWNLISFIFRGIYAAFKWLLELIVKFFTQCYHGLLNLFKMIGNFFGRIFRFDFKGILKGLCDFIIYPFRLIKRLLFAIGRFIINIFKYIFRFFAWIGLGIKKFFVCIFNGIKRFFVCIFNGIKNFFACIGLGIKKFFVSLRGHFHKPHVLVDSRRIGTILLWPFIMIKKLILTICGWICAFFRGLWFYLFVTPFNWLRKIEWKYSLYPFVGIKICVKWIGRQFCNIWTWICSLFSKFCGFFTKHSFFNLILAPFRFIKLVIHKLIIDPLMLVLGYIWHLITLPFVYLANIGGWWPAVVDFWVHVCDDFKTTQC